MRENFFKYNQQILLFFLWLSVIGIFTTDYFRALLSIAMIGFTLVGLLSAKPKDWIKNLVNNKALLALVISFLVVIPSVLYSNNLKYFGLRVQILIPFLVMPFAYAQMDKITDKNKKLIINTFILGVVITAIQALVFYFNNQEEVNQAYLESRVMPTMVGHHPTFSLMCAFSIYLLYYLFKNENKNITKSIIIILAVFLIVFLHIFSVRAGLFSFYGLVLLVIYEQIILKKQYILSLSILALCAVIAVFTFKYSPTVRNKLTNTQNDINNYKNGGSANDQSLGSRMISYKNAIEITQNSSWFLGCGLGDIEDLNNQIFEEKYPDVTKKIIPHNQFLYYMASVGILGLLVFVASFYFPALTDFKNLNLLAHYLVISMAFLIEAFLTTQLGVAYTIIFILLFVNKPKTCIHSDLA
ncbi:MAG: O-antigen ligase family protein [Bacteroidia bacterium]